MKPDGITVVSYHPGYVATALFETAIAKRAPKSMIQKGTFGRKVLDTYLAWSLGQIDLWTGTQTSLHVALNEDVPNHNGKFFAQSCSPKESLTSKSMYKGGWPLIDENPATTRGDLTPANAEALWKLSMEVCKKRL